MAQKRGGQRQSGNPARRAGAPAGSTPSGSGPSARKRFEEFSAPMILFLARLPRWAFPLSMALLLVLGLLLSNGLVGGLLLLVLVVALAWLTALSWPALTTMGRLLRLVTIGAALAVVYARLTGRM